MHCLVGIDDTDSSSGYCTTYLAFRIAIDLRPWIEVLSYPRLVRLNPNIPFKTRGNAAVCLKVETEDPVSAFTEVSKVVARLSDVRHGANSGLVFFEGEAPPADFRVLYSDALHGVVNPGRVRRLLDAHQVKHYSLGNGMGLVGAASSLAFDERYDHTFELISYRRPESLGTRRQVDSSSVKEMDRKTSPHTFNNYDYQKRRVLVAPHGPDPVFAGVRGDSPAAVLGAFSSLRFDEELEGYMTYISNQHTDAHLGRELDWKAYSSGWMEGEVERVERGHGGHFYVNLKSRGTTRLCAFYEPTGDLRRMASRLREGDEVIVFGGVRRPSPKHKTVLNVEKFGVTSLVDGDCGRLARGTYVSSTRANRHLTKPLVRYGHEVPGRTPDEIDGWISGPTPARALVGSR